MLMTLSRTSQSTRKALDLYTEVARVVTLSFALRLVQIRPGASADAPSACAASIDRATPMVVGVVVGAWWRCGKSGHVLGNNVANRRGQGEINRGVTLAKAGEKKKESTDDEKKKKKKNGACLPLSYLGGGPGP